MSTHSAVHDPRNDSVQIYINGEFFPRDEARISVFDSGYLVGDGIWDGMRFHQGSFIHIERHLDRLFSNAAAIDLDIGMTREEVAAALWATVERNNMESDVHVRLMITRGDKKTPSQHPANTVGGPNVVIIAEHKVASPEVAAGGIKLFTSTVRRPGPDVLDQKLNCHSKLHEVIALIQAMKAGADEALMLDVNGAVATCNATNFFIVRRGEVWTSTGQYCLNGITRGLVIELCRAEDIPVFERDFSLTDVYSADESFVTGTFGGLTPVTEVDGRLIGGGVVPGPMTSRLTGLLRAAIEVAAHG
jgi:branched-chain amino acid aminotransferase